MKVTLPNPPSFRDIPQFTQQPTYAVDMPVDMLDDWLTKRENEDGLELNPDFQRGHVWTVAQQIAFVEFFFRGGTTGRHIYFNSPGYTQGQRHIGDRDKAFVCVDGLQRLTAIRRFMRNEIGIFGGFKLSDFTDKPRVMRDTFRLHINDLNTRAEVLAWYREMNGAGTPHTEAELRRVDLLLEQETSK